MGGKGQMNINGKPIGEGRTYVVAEMSANHGQDFNRAVDIVYAAKEAGADAIKLQTYTPDTLTIDCDNQYFQIKADNIWKGMNLYRLYEQAYTKWDWHYPLKEIADKIGLDFFSTPFDTTAVDFLEELGVPVHKVASFENGDLPLLRYIAQTGKPIIMSTGMASVGEIWEAVDEIRDYGCTDLVLLKCTSAYPARLEEANVSMIPQMEEEFDCYVGLSDHTPGHIVPVASVVMGAVMIEKHLTLSRDIKTPDSSFSLEPHEFRAMVDAVRDTERVMQSSKMGITKGEETSIVFRRSLFVVRDIEQGQVLTSSNVRSIRPGYGLHPRHYDDIVSGTYIATQNIERGTPLSLDMIERMGYED
jgi:pseudaminic acid synthase